MNLYLYLDDFSKVYYYKYGQKDIICILGKPGTAP